VDVIPTDATRQRIPSDFPLEEGKVGCSTCHDVTWGCGVEPSASRSVPSRLRGGQMTNPMMFCFRCHAEERYNAFNAHDQLDAEGIKADTCLWCHASVPDVHLRLEGATSQVLRRQSFAVCRSCHRVARHHPAGGMHMEVAPTAEMKWHMSAYEMQATMRLSFPQLLKYAQATKREPRAMPLDDQGRITCITCHNPHEKGVLPARNPRAVGAEPKLAVNHRLRALDSNMCVACHEK